MVRLGQVAEFINGDRGKNYPSEGDFADKGIPFINAGHLTNGEVDFSDMNYISESRFHLLGSGKTRQNDILYCLRGSLGKTAIVHQKGDAAIASSLVIIRPSDDCSVGYLYHFLTSPFGHVEVRKFDNGSSQPNLSANSVKNYLLPLPPLTEQRRIAQILDKGEALQAKRRTALAQLDTLTQAIFLDMFGDPGRWPLVSLDSICRTIRDGTHKTPSYVQAGIPFITVKNMVTGSLHLTGAKFISPEEHQLLTKRVKPERGDILVSKDGTIGAACPVATDSVFSIFVSVALLKLRTALVDQTFLVSQFRAPWVQRQIDDRIKGIAIRHLHLIDFKQLRVILPPLSLQHDFAQRVAAVEKLRTAHRASLAQMDALFASFQYRAFRGELWH